MSLGYLACLLSRDLVVEVVTGYTESVCRVECTATVLVIVGSTVWSVVGTVDDSAIMPRSVSCVLSASVLVTN